MGIEEELNAGYEECSLVGFDKDFPFTQLADQKREEQMYKIIKYCWNNQDAFIESEEIELFLQGNCNQINIEFPKKVIWPRENVINIFILFGYLEKDILSAIDTIYNLSSYYDFRNGLL